MNTSSNKISAKQRIERAAASAQESFEEAKAKFAADFAINPASAIEWQAAEMVKLQTRWAFWDRLSRLAQQKELPEVLATAREECERQLRSFFGSNSTCLWHNAKARAEAQVYSDLLEYDLPGLERAMVNEN